MENVYYLKLVSGEDVIAKIESPEEDSKELVIEDPILVEYNSTGASDFTAGMRPWIPGLIHMENYPLGRKDVMMILPVEQQLQDFYETVVERNKNTDFTQEIEDDEYEEEEEEKQITHPYPKTLH